MAGNTVALEFAGDATKLQQAAKKSSEAIQDVGKSAKSAGDDFKSGSKEATDFTGRIGKLGAGVTGMTDAVDTAGGALSALNDLQQEGRERAARLARANVDVKQAQEDYNQALRDGKQATIDTDQAELDLEQARLDQATALKDYNTAVKEHGKNSAEARQAQIDMKQAGIDVKQAQEDAAQATRDAAQANIDAQGAQLDLNDAMHEAHPPELQQWGDKIQTVTPILSSLVGVVGLATAAQWLWNAAQLASPTTWIVLAVVALVAIIVVIATKTTWFQDLWKAAWGGIKDAAHKVGSWFKDTLWGKWIKGAWDGIQHAAEKAWNYMKDLPGKLKDRFAKIKDFLFAPFRSAFNAVATAWNNTIGRLHWTVPGWIHGFGGKSVSAPLLPKFHQGIDSVPGPPGSEMLAILQAGERVVPASSNGGETVHVTVTIDRDVLVDAVTKGYRRRLGDA